MKILKMDSANKIVKINFNKTANEFVGLKIEFKNKKEILSISLPIGYRIENEWNRKDIYNFFNVLAMYHNNDSFPQEKNNSFSIFSAIKLIENYMKYGIYKESIAQTRNNSEGKINWKKTLKDNTNFLISNLPIDIYSDKINYRYEGDVQKIQKYCLGYISKIIGVFFKFNFPISPKPFSDIEMLNILNKELHMQNIDSKKECLYYMISFIEQSKCIDIVNTKNTIIEIGTKNFEYIWEKLVDIKFKGIHNKKEYQPKTTYYFMPDLETEYHKKYAAPMRPDTIIKRDNMLAIVDAKYYAKGNLPGQYDINKQLGYAAFANEILLKNSETNICIRNMFILPWNNREEENIVKGNNNKNAEYTKKYKIECYATNRNFLDEENKINTQLPEFSKGLAIIATCYIDTKSMINMTSKQFQEEIFNNIVSDMDAVINKNIKMHST